jgi:deoxyribodipyrimidine photo-lyase
VFVTGPALAVPPNRARFLAQSLADLRQGLRERGGDLPIRDGDPVAETMRLAAGTGARGVFVADDVTRYAARRRRGLEAECVRHRLALTVTPQHTVVPAGAVSPAGGGHYRVFTPYWRAWSAVPWRQEYPAPQRPPRADQMRVSVAAEPPAGFEQRHVVRP